MLRLAVIAITLLSAALAAAAQSSLFIDFVKQRMLREPAPRGAQHIAFDSLCSIDRNPLARKVFYEYGSVFVSTTDVRLPHTCIFQGPADVAAFQSHLSTKKAKFGGVEIELQSLAMEQLEKARADAAKAGLSITPLDGAIAGRRSFDDTIRIWNSRFFRALDHWTRRGNISAEEAETARLAPIGKQSEMVLAWEGKGYYFSTDFSKSIFYSVAPPGTSQHLTLLAFDVAEAGDPVIRRLMNKYGWFQTIRTDQPHFTFLGVDESELPKRGLKSVIHLGNFYWVPDMDIRPIVAISTH